jgi:hypothetical protein
MDMDWIAIEPVHRKTVLGCLSEERNMFVAVKKIIYFILYLQVW